MKYKNLTIDKKGYIVTIEKNYNSDPSNNNLYEYSEKIIYHNSEEFTVELSGYSSKPIPEKDLKSLKSLFEKGIENPDLRIVSQTTSYEKYSRDFDDALITTKHNAKTIFNVSPEVPNGVPVEKTIWNYTVKESGFSSEYKSSYNDETTKISYYKNGLPSKVELITDKNGELTTRSITEYEELPNENYRFEDTKEDAKMLEDHITFETTDGKIDVKDESQNIDINLSFSNKDNKIETEKRVTKDNVTQVEKTNEITGETVIQKYENDELVDEEKITIGSSMVDEYENSYNDNNEYKEVC